MNSLFPWLMSVSDALSSVFIHSIVGSADPASYKLPILTRVTVDGRPQHKSTTVVLFAFIISTLTSIFLPLIRYHYTEMTLFSTFHNFSHHLNTYNQVISRCTRLMRPINETVILDVLQKSVFEWQSKQFCRICVQFHYVYSRDHFNDTSITF